MNINGPQCGGNLNRQRQKYLDGQAGMKIFDYVTVPFRSKFSHIQVRVINSRQNFTESFFIQVDKENILSKKWTRNNL